MPGIGTHAEGVALRIKIEVRDKKARAMRGLEKILHFSRYEKVTSNLTNLADYRLL
jgi:hypothetical protein